MSKNARNFQNKKFVEHHLRDHIRITTTKVVAFGLGYPFVSVPRNVERTWPDSLSHVIHDQSYWGLCCWTNQKRGGVISNQ